MSWLIGLGIFLGVLLLIGCIRVGGEVSYAADGVFLWLRIGPLRVTLLPQRPKKKTKKPVPKKKKQKPEQKKPEQKKSGGAVSLALELLPPVFETMGKLKRAIQLDILEIHLAVGDADPATAAIRFGQANAVLGALIPLVESQFKVKERKITTELNFQLTETVVNLRGGFSLTIGQAFGLLFGLAGKAIPIVHGHGKKHQKKEANG